MQRTVYLDRYFMRQLDGSGAVYREEDARLFGLPVDNKHADVSESRPAIDAVSKRIELEGFVFTNHKGYAVHESFDNLLTIRVKHGTWLEHTEQLLGAIMAQIDVVAPSDRALTIKIGETDPASAAMAEYDSEEESINFYAGKHGELLVNEHISELLFPQGDAQGTLNEFLQIAVAHECGHAFQKNLFVRRTIENLEMELRETRTSGESCDNLRERLSRASSTRYLERMCTHWQENPDYPDFEFACEIWADIFAQTRLKRFDGAEVGDSKPLQAMVAMADSITVEPRAPKPPDAVKEHFESLQGHISHIRHQKMLFPPFSR